MSGAEPAVRSHLRLALTHLPCGRSYRSMLAESPPIVCSLFNDDSHARLCRVSTSIIGFSPWRSTLVRLAARGTLTVRTDSPLEQTRASALTDVTPADVCASVEDCRTGHTARHSATVMLLPESMPLLGYQEPQTLVWRDLRTHVSAFVTPDCPRVLELAQAATRVAGRRAMGPERDDPRARRDLVKAIVEVIRNLGLELVGTVDGGGIERGVAFQRVQLPRQTLSTGRANCLDGSVLVASVLEALSLNPALVAIPGHVFVAWETLRGSGRWSYLETTLISTRPFTDCEATAAERAQAAVRKWLCTADDMAFSLWPLSVLRERYGILPL